MLSMKTNDNMGAMLLSYSRQVASAMVYLSVKGYVHCDLAARNILSSVDGVCKVRVLDQLMYTDNGIMWNYYENL